MNKPFSYKITKDRKVMIYRENKMIKIVKGIWCEKFIKSLPSSEEEAIQMKLAKITGHYKHGNERSASEEKED